MRINNNNLFIKNVNEKGLIKKQEVTNLDNKVKLLVLLFGIFALVMLNLDEASAEILRTGQGNVNYTFNNASRLGDFNNTGSTVLVVVRSSAAVNPTAGNWSIFGIFYNTSVNTWTRLAITGASGNSSCSGRTCNHTGNARGAMLVRITLPADTYRGSFRVAQNLTSASSVATEPANRSNRSMITIDNTVPTLTLAALSSALDNKETSDTTPLIRIDADENMTSMQLSLAGRLYNMTRVDADTFEYTFLNAIPHGSYVYTATAGDYANSNNFQTSTFTINVKSGDRSPAQKQLVAEIAAGQGMFAGEGQPKELGKTAVGAVGGGIIGGIVVPVIGIIPGAIIGGIIGFMF